MTAFTTLLDTTLASGKPITQSVMRALRDNLQAFAEGNATFNLANGAIDCAPYGQDGAAVAMPTTGGTFAYTSLTDNAGATLGEITRIFVLGDVDLTGGVTFTASQVQVTGSETGPESMMIQQTSAVRGIDATATNQGGASVGNGGGNAFGFGTTLADNFWRYRQPLIGGCGADGSGNLITRGGGSLVIIAEGDMDITSATINARGEAGGSSGYSGGGGGSVILICTGTLTETSATINADGGNGNGAGVTSGGGGGYIARVASAFTGTATTDVTGGSGSSNSGASGLDDGQITLTAAQIRSLINGLS